jgi:hypothetical protein
MDKIAATKLEITAVTEVMQENILRMNERQERLDHLQAKTGRWSTNSFLHRFPSFAISHLCLYPSSISV